MTPWKNGHIILSSSGSACRTGCAGIIPGTSKAMIPRKTLSETSCTLPRGNAPVSGVHTWGFPVLKGVGAILKLDEQKMEEGADLIKYFCKPCRPTKKNGGRTRNFPCHAPDKWELFKKYNARDVAVELGIKARLAKFPVPDFIWDEYHLDQEINDRGILVDRTLVSQAIAIDAMTKQSLRSRMQAATGLENPNSVIQMKGWLSGKGIEAESLDKKAVRELLPDADKDVADALSCRQQLAKASVSKYRAMQNAVCADGRARGCSRSTVRTGRVAGPGALSSCRTCLRTTWTTWKKPGTSSGTGTLKPWNFCTTTSPPSFPN